MTTGPDTTSSRLLLWTMNTADRELLAAALRHTARRRLPLWPPARRRARNATAAVHTLVKRLADAPAVEQGWLRFDAEACSQWLHAGAAARYGIDDRLNRANLPAAGGILDDLLVGLNDDDAPHVWAPRGGLTHVRMWRTGDNDGLDGGLLLVVNVHVGDGPVRICPMRLEPDELIRSGRSGVDAAVQALESITEAVNRECGTLFEAVTGAWAGRR